MKTINILSDEVVSKIAAGEVVARPASVVKELIDNAVDANAKSITIHITNGGKENITIIDNGKGMSTDDANLCIRQHATSKIKDDKDLNNINTLGFRGEALAAISSVSKLTLETKSKDTQSLEGTKLYVEGANASNPIPHGCPAGTSISVSDLFFNTPARKKFLKSDQVEFGHISSTVISLALANPDIVFELSHNNKTKLKYSKNDNILKRVQEVLGEKTKNALIEFSEQSDEISVHGFIGKPEIIKGSTKDIHVFINKRPIKDRIIQHAIMSGYESFITKGNYPVTVLYISINPTLVDVNVHPAKHEVRFKNGGMVHDFIKSSIRKYLSTSNSYSNSDNKPVKQPASNNFNTYPSPSRKKSTVYPFSFLTPIENTNNDPIIPEEKTEIPISETEFKIPISNFNIIGQYKKTYIICEDNTNQLVLIDQHAAHERLGFEILKNQYSKGKIEQQRLLIGERIELTPKEYSVIEEKIDLINKTGFETEPFGGSTIIVKSIPAVLGDVALAPLFEKIAAELGEYDSTNAINEILDAIFALIACHRQVRAGDTLTTQELNQLVKDIETFNITHCPHGRPVIVKFDSNEIAKWFKRT